MQKIDCPLFSALYLLSRAQTELLIALVGDGTKTINAATKTAKFLFQVAKIGISPTVAIDFLVHVIGDGISPTVKTGIRIGTQAALEVVLEAEQKLSSDKTKLRDELAIRI